MGTNLKLSVIIYNFDSITGFYCVVKFINFKEDTEEPDSKRQKTNGDSNSIGKNLSLLLLVCNFQGCFVNILGWVSAILLTSPVNKSLILIIK